MKPVHIATLEEIKDPRFQHEPVIEADRKIVCKCGFTSESAYHYGRWSLWKRHIGAVKGLVMEPERLLMGEAVSPAGRATWTVWLEHVGYDRPPLWEERKHLTDSKADYRKVRSNILRKMEVGVTWERPSNNLFFWPWTVAINKNLGGDVTRQNHTRFEAMADAYLILAKQLEKDWTVKTYDEMEVGDVAVTLTPITYLTRLIERCNAASGTAERLKRMQEIDEVLDQVEVLRRIRAEMFSKVAL